jgi:ribosomal protein L37E
MLLVYIIKSMKIYCQSCGTSMKYSYASKPCFCSSCGQPLGKGKTTHISKSKIRPRDDSEVEDDFEDDSHLYVPDNIHKLEFEVEGSLKQQGVRMGDIIPKPDDPEDA